MNSKNNIRVEMIRMIDNFVPFVKVDYMDKDAKEHTGLMLADTGATNNVIAMQSLKENGFKHSYLGCKDSITGLNGGVEVDQAIVDFNLLTLDENDDETETCHHDLFMVMPCYIIQSDEAGCDEKGEPLPPVEGLISSEFMAQQGWALDFGARIIYKRKAA